MVIPNLLNNIVSIAVMLVGNMLTVVGVSPYFLIVMAVLMVLYSRLQAYYQRSALQLERFEATSRSPLYQVNLCHRWNHFARHPNMLSHDEEIIGLHTHATKRHFWSTRPYTCTVASKEK